MNMPNSKKGHHRRTRTPTNEDFDRLFLKTSEPENNNNSNLYNK